MKTKSSDMHICEFFSNALQFQYHTTKLLTKNKKDIQFVTIK